MKLWRADIDALYKGSGVSRARGLAVPVKSFRLKREDFQAVIDGMEMDVVADIRAPDWQGSTLIATVLRARSGGSRCVSSAWRRRPALRSPTISVARCN